MATRADTITLICDLLDPLPITTKKMFGEYALYLDTKVIAFVTGDVLRLKVTSVTDERLTDDLLGEAYPGSKDYWCIEVDLLEDRDWAIDLVQRTAEALPVPPPKKPRKRRSTP